MERGLREALEKIARTPVPVAPKNNDPESNIFDCEMLFSEIRHRNLLKWPYSQEILADLGILTAPHDYFVDEEHGSIEWRFDDGRVVRADQWPLFTYVNTDHSIEWAWAKTEAWLSEWLQPVGVVKAWAEEHEYFQLLKPLSWVRNSENAWRLGAFCTYLADLEVVYRAAVDDTLSSFMAVTNFRTKGAA